MVFIALSLLLRRCLLPLLACTGLTSACCFAQSTFFAVESTPYDNQMARVQPVLAAISSETADEISLTTVNQWMSQLRQIPYRYSKQWQTPVEVSRTKRADCKGKAIKLYEIMHAIGATDVRFVIGRHRAGDWFTHAWLEWDRADGIYVLDPTFNRRALKTAQQNSKTYIPLYAYEGSSRFRAVNTKGIAEKPPRAVAAGYENWAWRNFDGLE